MPRPELTPSPFPAAAHARNNIAPAGNTARILKRILVVEDNEDMRCLNASALAHFGFQVDTSEDGASAWDTLQRQHYDLLITDNLMPKLTGVDLLRKLRSTCNTMPVIMATGTLPGREFELQPWLRPDAILIKPYTWVELVETARNVLDATVGEREWSASSSNWQNPPSEAGPLAP